MLGWYRTTVGSYKSIIEPYLFPDDLEGGILRIRFAPDLIRYLSPGETKETIQEI